MAKTKETEAKTEAMTNPETEAKTDETKAYDPNELVDYMAPLLPGSKQRDVFCAVNGETICFKRGVPVKIKRKFYDVLMNAQKQQLAAYQTMAQIQKQGEKPAAEM